MACALALVLCACVRPLPAATRQRAPLVLAPDERLRAWFGQMETGAAMLARAGARVALVPVGTPGAIRVVPGVRGKASCRYAGWWNPVARSIELWPACVGSDAEFAALFAHECAHALGAGHVGPRAGVAVMNPIIPSPPPRELTALDRAELARAGALGRARE